MSELREKIDGKIRISLLSANIAGGRYEPRINNHAKVTADSILAAVREAMLTDEVKSAAGWRLSRGALLTDQYHKDADYKMAMDDLALCVVEAAITAAGITESEVENDTD